MPVASPVIPSGHGDIDHFSHRMRKTAEEYRIGHAPLTSNALLATTGFLLQREAASHFIAQPMKTAVRALIGQGQCGVGLTGVAHYGMKFYSDPTVHNALGMVAYALFASEGLSRALEAEGPHLNRTSALGFWSAVTKSVNGGPMTTIPYFLDASCNAAEFAHGMSMPARSRILALGHELTHRWKTEDLAGLQRNAGRVMIAIAAFKSLALATNTSPDERAGAKFEQTVTDLYQRIEGDKWEQALAELQPSNASSWPSAETPGAVVPPERQAEQAQADEATLAMLQEMVAAIAAGESSGPHRFAHVVENAPVSAVRLMQRYPSQSREALDDLRRADPAAYRQLRDRYRVDAAFVEQAT